MNTYRNVLNHLGLIDFFHHLMAPVCQRCDADLPLHTHAPGICNPCWSMVYEPLMVHDPSTDFHTWSCGVYTQYMAQQLLQAKRNARPSAMNFWAKVLETRASSFITQPWDVMVPMPFHRLRMMQRGYSLPHWVAHRLAQLWPHIPIKSFLMKASRPAQAKQACFADRKKNIKGAFTVNEDLGGLRILLVDDVRTSGATLTEAAKTLYKAGAKKVDGFVLLQAPQRKTKSIL